MRSLTKLKYLVSGYLLSEMNKKVIGLLLFADVFVYLSGIIYEGFNLHTMWGLYADKGYGACLVFDNVRCIENSRLSPANASLIGVLRKKRFSFLMFT